MNLTDGLNLGIGIAGLGIGIIVSLIVLLLVIFVTRIMDKSGNAEDILRLEKHIKDSNERITLIEAYLGVEMAKPIAPHLAKKEKKV